MSDGTTVFWNFCDFAHHKCLDDGRNAYAVKGIVDENYDTDNDSPDEDDIEECVRLTSDQKLSDYEQVLINEDDPSEGIILKVGNGDVYSTNASGNDTYWNIEIVVRCTNVTEQSANYSLYSTFYTNNVTVVKNTYIIEGESTYGCPVFQLSKIWQYLGNHKVLFSIILVIVGLLECFFGYKLLKPTLFIIGYFSGFGILVAVLGEFVIGPDTEAAVVWVILIVTIVFGALSGYLMMAAKRVGFLALGFWLGVIIAFLLNNAILYKIDNDSVVWITILVLGCFFGFLSCILHQHIVILSTGIVGAYATIRPFGWIADGFPNEFTLVEQLRNGTITSIPTEFYLFFILILLLAFIGIRFQYYYYYKEIEYEQQDDVSLAEDDFGEDKQVKAKKLKIKKNKEHPAGDQSVEDEIDENYHDEEGHENEKKGGFISNLKNMGFRVKNQFKRKNKKNSEDLNQPLVGEFSDDDNANHDVEIEQTQKVKKKKEKKKKPKKDMFKRTVEQHNYENGQDNGSDGAHNNNNRNSQNSDLFFEQSNKVFENEQDNHVEGFDLEMQENPQDNQNINHDEGVEVEKKELKKKKKKKKKNN